MVEAKKKAVERLQKMQPDKFKYNETFARKPFHLHAALKTYSIGHL